MIWYIHTYQTYYKVLQWKNSHSKTKYSSNTISNLSNFVKIPFAVKGVKVNMNINVSDQAVWKSSRRRKVDLTPLFNEQWLHSNTWMFLFSNLYSHYKVTLTDDEVDIYCIMSSNPLSTLPLKKKKFSEELFPIPSSMWYWWNCHSQ